MNNKIDLTRILKGCPKGTELYSPIFGTVYFDSIDDYNDYPIIVTCGKQIQEFDCFAADGKYSSKYNNGECMLFPSKDNRDWSTFRCPKQKFSPYTLNQFDKVLVRTEGYNLWTVDLFSFIGDQNFKCIGGYFKRCIPYNDETKYLVGTSDEAPDFYRYWED